MLPICSIKQTINESVTPELDQHKVLHGQRLPSMGAVRERQPSVHLGSLRKIPVLPGWVVSRCLVVSYIEPVPRSGIWR